VLLDSATKALDLRHLVAIHLGIGSNVVRPGQREERKSMGAERTFNALSDTNSLLAKLDEITSELATDMRDGGWAGKTVTLKYKTDAFQGVYF
jgi:DNA polymerase kappa